MSDSRAAEIARYWVNQLGLGFHPDTRGRDYRPALSPSDAERYDNDMAELFAVADDPYAVGLKAVHDKVLMLDEPRYRTEFPDFPEADLPPIPSHWQDMSWRNESCPRFQITTQAAVYIDYADPAAREFPETERFVIVPLERTEHGDDLLATDDWREVLAWEYKARIGYDPFADDPSTTEAEVAQTLGEHAAAVAEGSIPLTEHHVIIPLSPFGPIIDADKMTIATVETEHFSFEAHGISEAAARAALADGFAIHAKQYGLDADWADAYHVETREFWPGMAFRDGAPLSHG